MAKVIVKIKLTNYVEEQLKKLKLLKGKPRSVETEALVDTGATRLYLQSRVIRALGLRKEGDVVSRTTNSRRKRAVYQTARLDLMGRQGNFDVVEVDDDVSNLLGQIPLEYLDFVVDPQRQKLVPNPEHGGTQMSEEYCLPSHDSLSRSSSLRLAGEGAGWLRSRRTNHENSGSPSHSR